ncbi:MULTISPECIES: FAS1-like dehydratase domain-containing protein [unclassified Frankia]|uniref:FAS1-like dehydratase domain-containing protein n=1 Tax=unclassified Frankia TaxID=2632575 RepID=UPI002AD29EE1|nr:MULTISPECIES: MaoC family dehydratase N-terminal domain-containing protein [unclassified Frankia]
MGQFTFPVEAGQIMLFARSVADPNPVYHDAERAGEAETAGIIAPPTFVQSSAQYDPDYPLRPRTGEAWFGSGREPSGVTDAVSGGGRLHAEQHFEYFRQVRPGDLLTVTNVPGNTWEKTGRRGGKLLFEEQVTEYRDAAGELVVRARGVSVRPEKPVEQGAN